MGPYFRSLFAVACFYFKAQRARLAPPDRLGADALPRLYRVPWYAGPLLMA